jgi:nitrogen fixation protein NifQ
MSRMLDAAAHSAELHALLLRHAAQPDALLTRALAGVMSSGATRPAAYAMPIARLAPEAQQALMAQCFPGLPMQWPCGIADDGDEFGDLLALLRAHATDNTPASDWLAHAIATACMGANHLWQDMGLPDRDALQALMQRYFTSLKTLNAANMRWKKFFYRELCAQAEVLICKSPSCGVCVDEPVCFGLEGGKALLPDPVPITFGAALR